MISIIKENDELWKRFTRGEEYAPLLVDGYDRFPHYASKERDILEPSVSKLLLDHGFKFKYPNDHPFAVCLTHDIDSIYTSAKSKAYSSLVSLKSRNTDDFFTKVRQLRSRKLPLHNFQEIMALEERYGARSSFYFLALAPGDKDYTYNIQDVKEELKEIVNAGWEVGLHGGHRAFCEPQALEAEKKRLESALGRSVIGYRNHFLRFQVPETWHHLSRAGFKYDATLGYADCVGFRNGMCHPFKPYDLRTGQEIDILEIPLTIMDCTLDQYMRLDDERAWDLTRNLIDTVEKYNGVITILWHNTYMQGKKLKFYEKILKYCHEKRAWMTSGEEIAKAMIQ
jgi:peptidoglycan/xylan/chitin deacetylase (PgdA/CDA1 family)